MEQNPINNTQPNRAISVENNQSIPNFQQNIENQQGFIPQYHQQINPQQNTQQVIEQPRIINTCIYSKEFYLQAMTKTRKTLTFMLICFSICLSITILVQIFTDGSNENIFMFAFFLWALIITLLFKKIIKKNTHVAVQRDMLLYGTVSQPVTYFYNNHFTYYNPQSQSRFFMPYQNIVDISEYNDIYVITLKENLTVILQKNGFNLGNAELFKAFIQRRVPVTAKIKFK